MAKKTDADATTLALLKQVRDLKAKIAVADRPAWKTNCNLRMAGVSLHVEANLAVLAATAGMILRLQDEYERGANSLNLTAPPVLRIEGYTASEWLDDLRSRVAKVQVAAERERLAKLELRLNAIVSPELRSQMELEAIKAEMGVV